MIAIAQGIGYDRRNRRNCGKVYTQSVILFEGIR